MLNTDHDLQFAPHKTCINVDYIHLEPEDGVLYEMRAQLQRLSALLQLMNQAYSVLIHDQSSCLV